ncbi:MAG: insulinase family protein [Candidatus Omnitrophota bacterium]|jgi:predicted Zn-dependent peptidase|nr:MAG: insulinase family protein [Candidatus Omnitrophota bacterium]
MKIKKHVLFAFTLLLTLVFISTGIAQKSYKELSYPKLNDIQIPEIERIVLPNGMILFLLEDHELPLINLSARIGGGSVFEPPEKIGLAEITGTVMRTGGSATMSGEKMDEILETIAASVETGIGRQSGSASMSTLKEHLDQGLSILADVLMNPAFPQDKIDLAKVEARSLISRRNDEPREISGREFQKMIYGGDSPYARHSEYAAIDAITRDDLIEFHQTFFYPNNVMMSVWGDFDTKEMIEKIDTAFGGWKRRDSEVPVLPAVDYQFDSSVNLIKKEDIHQAYIEMGHLGGKRDDPDYFALIVMNQILGGGFTSRMVKTVRTQMGLAYSTWGVYGTDYAVPGAFSVGCQTKAESAIDAILAMKCEIEKMTQASVTDEELALAKEQYLNSYVFHFDTKGEIVNRLMTFEYFGYPKDFLQKTKESVEKVTKEDVLRVAKAHLHPDKLRILVVGNPEKIDPPLSTLGEVNEIDITIPVPEEEKPEATRETLAQGKTILERAIAACGGNENFQSMKTMHIKGDMTLITPQGDLAAKMEASIAMPNQMRQSITLPMGSMTQIYNDGQAWIVMPNGVNPLPDALKEELKNRFWRMTGYLFAHADQDDLTVQALERKTVDGQECEILHITPADAKSLKLYLHAETLLPVKIAYVGLGMQGGPGDMEEWFSDIRDVNGMKTPFKTVIFEGSIKAAEIVITEMAINPDMDPAVFQPETK